MGARLYAPTTGRFLTIDPIHGGNDNRYTYPPDPINKLDLDGRSWLGSVAHWAGVVSDVTAWIPGLGGLSAAAGLVSAGAHYARGDRQAGTSRLISTAIGVAFGGAGKVAFRAISRGVAGVKFATRVARPSLRSIGQSARRSALHRAWTVKQPVRAVRQVGRRWRANPAGRSLGHVHGYLWGSAVSNSFTSYGQRRRWW